LFVFKGINVAFGKNVKISNHKNIKNNKIK